MASGPSLSRLGQPGPPAAAQIPNQQQLTQAGLDRYKAGDLPGAIALWTNALATASPQTADTVALRQYLARAYQDVGQIDQAIQQFEQIVAVYRQTADRRQLASMLIETAQAYSSIGQHRKAIELLCGGTRADQHCTADSALAIARQQANVTSEIAALGSLGNAHRLRGDYEDAIECLEQSLTLARQQNHSEYQLSALNGLGITFASLAKRDYRRLQFAEQAADSQEAQKFRQQAQSYDAKAIDSLEAGLVLAHKQHDAVNELRSLLNLVLPYHRSQQASTSHESTLALIDVAGTLRRTSTDAVMQQAQTLLNQLPDSREKAYATIRLVSLAQALTVKPTEVDSDPTTRCVNSSALIDVVALLNQAIAIAQRIQDQQSTSFALGRLGHVYECRQQYEPALALTQQAELAAVNQESLYLWEWQAGRILQAQGKTTDSIAAYELAVKTLQSIRGDLAIAGRDFQFDFRDTVEPVYRELTALRLARAAQSESSSASKTLATGAASTAISDIESALNVIDSLRLAEIQNYFGDDCSLEAIAKPVPLIDKQTAIFSSIILGDRVAVILTLPEQANRSRSQVHWLPTTSQTVTATVNALRLRLEKRSDLANTYLEPTQQIYDWLIRPFAADLQAAHIETLVFIQDGILRSIPMAALHDGKQFLVEQYAIASTLSLTLVDPTRLDPQSLRVLGFGLTAPSVVAGPTYFEPLTYVKAELASIERTIPGSKGYLDAAFTPDRLQQELTQNAFPIVHLATHGRFGIDSRDTFLVTGQQTAEPRSSSHPQRYNEKLTMNAIYRMIREIGQGGTLELLTLTACETAAGSDRDALGIAGISLQAGAKSAVASLWQVDDQSTAQLITQFYQGLRQGMSRSKALQVAQKNWIQTHSGERGHPGYWAALILVGNWL